MNLANLPRVKSRFIQILGANRLAYSNVVGTGNAGTATWKYDQEITDILLEADAQVIVEGYFQSEMSLKNRFLTVSANIQHGTKLPEFVGIIGKAEYSTNGSDWLPSQEADSKADVIGASAGASYIGAAAMAGHHFFEEGYAYHTSPYFRIEYPNFSKTTDLQSLEVHEPAVLCAALALAYKEYAIHAVEYYDKKSEYLLERIRQGSIRMKSYSPRALPAAMRG